MWTFLATLIGPFVKQWCAANNDDVSLLLVQKNRDDSPMDQKSSARCILTFLSRQ